MSDWQPIETAPTGPHQLLCAHDTKKWIRFGKRLPGMGDAWYYSGTNERSQWSMIQGDEPTHWMPMPKLPTTDAR
jgi:hypothetical protein